jgi:hypothetical protein
MNALSSAAVVLAAAGRERLRLASTRRLPYIGGAGRWRTREGLREQTFSLGELKRDVLQFVPGRTVCYVTDASCDPRNQARIAEFVAGTDLLFIDAVFVEADEPLATRKSHLTTTGRRHRPQGGGEASPTVSFLRPIPWRRGTSTRGVRARVARRAGEVDTLPASRRRRTRAEICWFSGAEVPRQWRTFAAGHRLVRHESARRRLRSEMLRIPGRHSRTRTAHKSVPNTAARTSRAVSV